MFDLNNINFGKNLVWFVGVVEDRMDPNFLGRVKVRCFGYHTASTIDIPTEDLPWAMVMQPTTSAAQTDVGKSPTGLVEGSWVIGIFLDGDEAQQPLIMGSIGGYANKPDKLNYEDSEDYNLYGFKDVRPDSMLSNRGFPNPPTQVRKRMDNALGVEIDNDEYVERYPRIEGEGKATTPKLARGMLDLSIAFNRDISTCSTMETTSRVYKEPLLSKIKLENRGVKTSLEGIKFNQPTSPYSAMYPFNHVWETESGHIIEYDDTPRGERIHEYHRSGTFREIHPDGKLVQKTVNERYDLTEHHSYEYAKGRKYSTYNQGYALMINAANLAAEHYTVRVCGTSDYNLTVEGGNFNIKTPTGRTTFNSSSLRYVASNEILQDTQLLDTVVGTHNYVVRNSHIGKVAGLYELSTGSSKISSAMETNFHAGDNFTIGSNHQISVIAENDFTMPTMYAPHPLGVEVKAKHGHIELNAQDGDTRISARSFDGLPGPFRVSDVASFTVTSANPTSIATTAQFQYAPEFERHQSHPASIIGQTQTGYIYFRSSRGNIVLETTAKNSVKLVTTQLGSVNVKGGSVDVVSTATNISTKSRLNKHIESGQGIVTRSRIGTYILSDQEIFARAKSFISTSSKLETMVHSDTAVRLGDRSAVEPAIKGSSFMQAFNMHTHLTAVGPTSPVNLADPTISNAIANAYCKKTFVF